MKLARRSLHKWIEAAIILVIAILLIVAGAAYKEGSGTSKDAVNAISTVIGIVLIVSASLSLIVGVIAAIKSKKHLAVLCAPGAALLAIGVSLVVLKYAGDIILIILYVIPYMLIALGGLIIADSIFNLVKILKSKNTNSWVFTLPTFVYGFAALIIGILSIDADSPVIPRQIQIIVLGVLLILYAIIVVILTVVKLPKAVVVIEDE